MHLEDFYTLLAIHRGSFDLDEKGVLRNGDQDCPIEAVLGQHPLSVASQNEWVDRVVMAADNEVRYLPEAGPVREKMLQILGLNEDLAAQKFAERVINHARHPDSVCD